MRHLSSEDAAYKLLIALPSVKRAFNEIRSSGPDITDEQAHRMSVDISWEVVKSIYPPPNYKHIEHISGSKEAGVYLIKSSTGNYKIGYTSNLLDRLHTFNVKLPFEIDLEHFIPTNDYVELELWLHQRFSSRRVNGEWFALTDDDVTCIKTL